MNTQVVSCQQKKGKEKEKKIAWVVSPQMVTQTMFMLLISISLSNELLCNPLKTLKAFKNFKEPTASPQNVPGSFFLLFPEQ